MYSKNKDYRDEYVSNGLEEEVNYDRFHQKGRNTNKRKLKSQKSFKHQRKYEKKYRNNVRKNDRDSKIYENQGFAIEEQKKALIEHIKKQEQHIATEIETSKREKQLKKIEKFQNDMNRIIREKEFAKEYKKKQIIDTGKELVRTKRRLIRKLNRNVDLYNKIEDRYKKVQQDQCLIRIEIEENCHKQELNMLLFSQVNDCGNNYYSGYRDAYYSREMNTYNRILELGYTDELEYDNY